MELREHDLTLRHGDYRLCRICGAWLFDPIAGAACPGPPEPSPVVLGMQARGTHPCCFRSGEWATVTGLEVKEGRPCLTVRFEDGAVDQWPVFLEPQHYEVRVAEAEPVPAPAAANEPDPDEVRLSLSVPAERRTYKASCAVDAAARAWLKLREQPCSRYNPVALHGPALCFFCGKGKDAHQQPAEPAPTMREPAASQPSIAQVIEACGGDLKVGPDEDGDGWVARSAPGYRAYASADTPEAAIVKLYDDAVARWEQQRDEAAAKLQKLGRS